MLSVSHTYLHAQVALTDGKGIMSAHPSFADHNWKKGPNRILGKK